MENSDYQGVSTPPHDLPFEIISGNDYVFEKLFGMT
jgi:hypothetical protein